MFTEYYYVPVTPQALETIANENKVLDLKALTLQKRRQGLRERFSAPRSVPGTKQMLSKYCMSKHGEGK